MEEDSASAGAPPETTAAARDPTDVACSECVAEAAGAADGSAVEELHAVGTMPLYAKPVVLAAGRATQQRETPRTISCSTNSTAEWPAEPGGGLAGSNDGDGGKLSDGGSEPGTVRLNTSAWTSNIRPLLHARIETASWRDSGIGGAAGRTPGKFLKLQHRISTCRSTRWRRGVTLLELCDVSLHSGTSRGPLWWKIFVQRP